MWWLPFLLVCASIAVIYLLDRKRLRKIRERNRRLNELYDADPKRRDLHVRNVESD
jgi:hypothetical protein